MGAGTTACVGASDGSPASPEVTVDGRCHDRREARCSNGLDGRQVLGRRTPSWRPGWKVDDAEVD